MVDILGGPKKVNNFLSTLNIPTINDKTLKEIERRAGGVIENVSKEITKQAAADAYKKEMAWVMSIYIHLLLSVYYLRLCQCMMKNPCELLLYFQQNNAKVYEKNIHFF